MPSLFLEDTPETKEEIVAPGDMVDIIVAFSLGIGLAIFIIMAFEKPIEESTFEYGYIGH